MDDAWGIIREIVKWLDDSSTLPPETEKLLRIMKLTEEVGEVTQAVIGTLGQNPRKGVTHTWEDVQAELCDVILTAMVGLTPLTPDARETFNGHLTRVANRSLGTPRADATTPSATQELCTVTSRCCSAVMSSAVVPVMAMERRWR